MSDFSDRPLVAGELVGLRTFDVADDGALVGVTHPAEFKPGLNEAVCYGGAASMSSLMRQLSRSMAQLNGTRPPPVRKAAEPTPSRRVAGHTLAGLRCTCGFYAYFDGSNQFHTREDRVQGVIRGTGVCTVGARGFRASKAELVALVDPVPEPVADCGLWDRFSDWANRSEVLSPVVTSAGVLMATIIAIPVVTASFYAGLYSGLISLLLPLVGIAIAVTNWRAFGHGLDRKYPSLPPYPECARSTQVRQFAAAFTRVRNKYPDVPVYDSLDAALAEHPLTVPEKAVAS